MRNLLLSGGPGAHEFAQTSAAVEEILSGAGFTSEIETDVNGALEHLADSADVHLVTMNMMFCFHHGSRLRGGSREPASLSERAREGLKGHLQGGGGLLALHTASICFDDWPEWQGILGGRWNWTSSRHPPLGPAHVRVAGDADGLTDGLDDFETLDEIYGFLDLEPDVTPLLTSRHGGADHPVCWAREVGAGRVVYDALGHDPRGYRSPAHRQLVHRAARWAAKNH